MVHFHALYLAKDFIMPADRDCAFVLSGSAVIFAL